MEYVDVEVEFERHPKTGAWLCQCPFCPIVVAAIIESALKRELLDQLNTVHPCKLGH